MASQSLNNLILGDLVAEVARSYLGCPYHHQGRVRAGIDCLGLVIAVCHDLGLSQLDWGGYSPTPDGQRLKSEIEKHCTALSDPEPGALLLFKIRHHPQHVGIATGDGDRVIHAYAGVGRVSEHNLDDWWARRIVGIYRLPGVERYG